MFFFGGGLPTEYVSTTQTAGQIPHFPVPLVWIYSILGQVRPNMRHERSGGILCVCVLFCVAFCYWIERSGCLGGCFAIENCLVLGW